MVTFFGHLFIKKKQYSKPRARRNYRNYFRTTSGLYTSLFCRLSISLFPHLLNQILVKLFSFYSNFQYVPSQEPCQISPRIWQVSSVFSFLILKVILSNWTDKVDVVFKKLTEEQCYGLCATLILGKWCYAGQHYWSFCSITMFTKVLLEFLKWIRHSLWTCHIIPHPLIKCTLISYSC